MSKWCGQRCKTTTSGAAECDCCIALQPVLCAQGTLRSKTWALHSCVCSPCRAGVLAHTAAPGSWGGVVLRSCSPLALQGTAQWQLHIAATTDAAATTTARCCNHRCSSVRPHVAHCRNSCSCQHTCREEDMGGHPAAPCTMHTLT